MPPSVSRPDAPRRQGPRLALAAVISVLVVSCSDGGGSDSATGDGSGDEGGSVSLSMSSTPVSDVLVTGVMVSVRGVELRRVDQDTSDWIAVAPNPALLEAPLNLLHLRGGISMDLLADEPVPPGAYDEARLLLAAPEKGESAESPRSIVELNGDGAPGGEGIEFPLFLPSASASGVKFKLAPQGALQVRDGGTATVVSAFDLQRSLHMNVQNGETVYILHPVVRAAPAGRVGSIGGAVLSGSPACPVLLHAYEDGTYRPTEVKAKDETKRFRHADASNGVVTGTDGPVYELPALEPGSYELVAAAYDPASGAYLDGSVVRVAEAVAVAAGEQTAVDVGLPDGLCGTADDGDSEGDEEDD